VVKDRGTNAVGARFMLTNIDRVASLLRLLKFDTQGICINDRGICVGRQTYAV
jgi:hypothetical protein